MKVVTPVDVSHTTDAAWTDVDLSSHLGSDAGSVAGVVLYVRNATATDYQFGVRKNGSTDDIRNDVRNDSHTVVHVGVDSNDIVEIYAEDASEITFHLLGYATTAEAEFRDNAFDGTPGSDDTWTDVDLSSLTGSNTALYGCGIFENTSGAGSRDFSVRPNGSTDSRTTDEIATTALQGFIIPCDGSEIFEAYLDNVSQQNLWVTGWIYDNATTIINATEYGANNNSTWESKDVSADVGTNDIAVAMVASRGGGAEKTGSIRKPGDSIPVEEPMPQAYYGWAGLDGSQNVEIITSGANGVEFWLYGGFSEPAGGSDTNVSATTDALTLTEQSATVNAETNVQASSNSLTLTALAATITLSVTVTATTDTLSVTPHSATVNAETNVQAGVDALTLTEQSATVNAETNVQTNVDALTVTEHSATVDLSSNNTNVSANVDALTLTEQQATVNAETNVQANADSLSLTELSATVSAGINVSANTDALSLTEQAATVNAETNVQAQTDALTVTTQGASVVLDIPLWLVQADASGTWTDALAQSATYICQREGATSQTTLDSGSTVVDSGETLLDPAFNTWSVGSVNAASWNEESPTATTWTDS